MVQYLQKNLPLNPQLLKDITCLSPHFKSCDWTVYSIGRPASQFPHLFSKRDVFIVKDQWRLYKLDCVNESRVEEVQRRKLYCIDYYWSKIFQLPSSSRDRKYTHLSKIIQSCLSIPNGNANVQRNLSDNKNTLA